MSVPRTVRRALDERSIDGRTCLEAGAGAGNATEGLLEAGAERVYAVTIDPDHAADVRDRFADDGDRVVVLYADLRSIPIPDDAVEFVTAHALFNVLDPADATAIAGELTRVAESGAGLVVDDYAPLPEDAEIRRLFAAENAAAELTCGRPELTFYPALGLHRLFEGFGWEHDRTRTILDPVPWTSDHVEAHAEIARSHAATLPTKLEATMTEHVDGLVAEIGSEDAGEMYSVAMSVPHEEQ